MILKHSNLVIFFAVFGISCAPILAESLDSATEATKRQLDDELTDSIPRKENVDDDFQSRRELFRQRLMDRMKTDRQTYDSGCTKCSIAGLEVAVWEPKQKGKMPLVIFSHGFGGSSTQSSFLMKALSEAGYLVFAPNHEDAHQFANTNFRPQVPFAKPQDWSDKTYIDRHDDIAKLIQALHSNPTWKDRIDWSKLAVCGHSLGGYTALGVAGAWPSWKIDGVKAVVALSPFVTPYTVGHSLGKLQVPVMYQGGTKDFGITPSVKRTDGAFDQTRSPAYFVDFDGFNHFTWSDFNRDPAKQEAIDYYCIAFLDKYVKGKSDDDRLLKQIPLVDELKRK